MNKGPFQAVRRFLLAAPWQSRAHRAWFILCSACLSLYMAYVTYLAQSGLFSSLWQTVAALCVFAAYALALFGLLLAGVERAARWSPKPARTGTGWKTFWLSMALSMAVLGFALLACWPGGVSYDAANQWRQVQSGEFNNWHPVFHTLLIWLATRAANSYPWVVLVQLAAFSAALAYLVTALRQSGVPAWLALAVQGVVVLSQPVQNALMYVWKDNAMTIGCLVLAAQGVGMLRSGGGWLQKPRNALCFGLALAFTTLVRHNALLFTLPMLLLALGCYGRRGWGGLVAAGTLALCLLLVQGPLYGALDIVYPSNTAEEAVGLPMTLLGNAQKEQPQALDAQASAFLETLAPQEKWQTVYRRSDYNSIKFTFPRELIKNTPVGDILGMALHTAQRAPRLAFETFNETTDLVWGLSGGEGYERVSNSGDLPEAPYQTSGRNALGRAVMAFLQAPMELLPLGWLTQNIGVQLLLLLLVTLWALYRSGVQALLFAVPMLVYDLATMLLLCGQDARFFQFTMAISLPCMLALAYAPGKTTKRV